MLPDDARCDWMQSYGRLQEDGIRLEVVAGRVGRDAHREDERGRWRRLPSLLPEPGPASVPGRDRRGSSDRSGRRRLPIPRRLASRSLPVGSRTCGASGTSRPVRARKCIQRRRDRLRATTRPVQAPRCRPGTSARARPRERAHGEEAPSPNRRYRPEADAVKRPRAPLTCRKTGSRDERPESALSPAPARHARSDP